MDNKTNEYEIAKCLLLLQNNNKPKNIEIFRYLENLLDKDESFSNVKLLNKDYFYFDLDHQILLDTISLYNNCLQNNIKKVEKMITFIKYIPDIFGNTPLFYTVIHNYYELTILLLENGMNVNHRDCLGRTVLHIACREGNKYMINLLLRYGADQHIKDYFFRYPIIVAFIYKKDSIIEELLLNGFKVYLKLDNNDFTILHLATIYGSISIIELILRYRYKNIYINDKTKNEGITALDLSIGKDNIYNLLLKNGAFSNNNESRKNNIKF